MGLFSYINISLYLIKKKKKKSLQKYNAIPIWTYFKSNTIVVSHFILYFEIMAWLTSLHYSLSYCLAKAFNLEVDQEQWVTYLWQLYFSSHEYDLHKRGSYESHAADQN